ncbi:major capsid protein [Dipodfec virus UOA04_Rod_524]|nr:major capsid protein [Dipodfec virus UOA04_Rod_524]
MGVFSRSQGPANDVKRNGFDGSFQNHFTFNFGQLVPCFCKEVGPGDTFEINSAMGLNFMPTVFPVQSKINATCHFFYVRGKNLWKDYYDWYFGTKQGLVPPTISPKSFRNKALTGSIYDYMGLPTTISSGSYGDLIKINPVDGWGVYDSSTKLTSFYPLSIAGSSPYQYYQWITTDDIAEVSSNASVRDFYSSTNGFDVYSYTASNTGVESEGQCNLISSGLFVAKNSPTDELRKALFCGDGSVIYYGFRFGSNYKFVTEDFDNQRVFHLRGKIAPGFSFAVSKKIVITVASSVASGEPVLASVEAQNVVFDYKNLTFDCDFNFRPSQKPFLGGKYFNLFAYIALDFSDRTVIQTSNLNNLIVRSSSPATDFVLTLPSTAVLGTSRDIGFEDANVFSSGAVTINALPFRAYESIYNAFYRDARNNPFTINGKVEYNKFITSDEGGIDNFNYEIRYRNWENDFLTTAQPTPQFGIAPLVGITSSGTMSFSASEDGKTYNVQANVGSDGTTIDSVSYSENLPSSVRRSLVDVVSSGISINDFRNVNAFQRFLETSMRRGLKAFDQIKAHFNVDVDEKLLDMPEFIGGFNTVVSAQKVDSTVETPGSPLGSYAGQLSALSGQKHGIKCFCDQPGYIIGIVCCHPVPLYSQLLPKMFLKVNSLDNYMPEFGQIGMQPILMREVAPVQAWKDDPETLTNVFGYQRAWYDLLSNVDEVHGLFRTQLRNFVLNRVFDSAPKLGPDFTIIDPKHLNDIFSVTVDNDEEVNHKILAKVVFDLKMIRPIPKFGIPKLEPNV